MYRHILERILAAFCALAGVCFASPLNAENPNSTTASALGQERPSRIQVLKSDEAWQLLSVDPENPGQSLPAWARALATPLPRTTGNMLKLDYLHRVDSPLDAKLRAKIRWVAGHANRCAFSEHYALADLRRAGADQAEIDALVKRAEAGSKSETSLLQFAHTLTLDGSAVTDKEVATLIADYREKQVMAMVLLIAYANFQDRLLLTLGLSDKDETSLEPIAVQAAKGKTKETTYQAAKREPIQAASVQSRLPAVHPDWSEFNFTQIQERLESQRSRKPRIKLPDAANAKKEGDSARPKRRTRVRWTLVCMTYQPQLSKAWFACMGSFRRESKQDRVFEESLFWVITRSLQCFY